MFPIEQKKRKRLPLFWQIMLWIMLCWLLLLSLNLAVTLRFSLDTLQSQLDNTLTATVKTLAESPSVRDMVRRGECDREMSDYLGDMVRNSSDLQYITIAGTDSIRIYHIDPDYIGKPFIGGDQYRALAGERYISDTTAEQFGEQRRAFEPILDETGQVIGFIMASATYERIHELRLSIYSTYTNLFLVLLLCTLLISGALAVFLGRNLRGVRPDDLLRVYLTQNDTINALDEGLISFDKSGKVRLVNAAAAKMLGHREDLLVGQQVDDLIRAEDGASLRGLESGMGIQSSRPNILARPVHLPDSNLWARRVLILTDKSEVIRYAEELVGTRHMLSALRANTHEFLNKLQVISGLLQMGYVSESLEYIGSIAEVHEHILGPVMKLIRNPNVAALILGKEGNMRELNIDLVLMRNSVLPERSRYLTTRELVTVVGNLLENAMEATNSVPDDQLRSVTLQLTEDEKGLLIMVSDTGEGISPENLPHIFDNGFSTKASSGRGVGMKLIQEIVDRHGGSIDVDTEPGSGTTFFLFFSRERGAQQ